MRETPSCNITLLSAESPTKGIIMRRMTEQEFRAYSLSGNLYKLIIQVGTPLAVFALFNTLFSILDTMMASHLGTIDVSTVAYMNQLRMVLNAIGTGMITGSMILINREYGAGNNEKAGILINTLVRLILMISAVFLIMLPFVPWLLDLISTPEEFIEEGAFYFRVLMIATVINFINLVYINVEKTRGRTSIIMVLNIITMVIKLTLSALFIYVLEKGIVYIAVATLITYSLFALYSLFHLFDKKSIFRIIPSLVFKVRKGIAKNIVDISYPVAVEDSAFSLGRVVVNSLAGGYGAEMIGALGISNNVSAIAANFENGFSDASSAIVSQNYGAGKYKRAVAAYKANIVITLAASVLALSILFLANDFLLDIFATSKTGYDLTFKETIRSIFIYDSIGCLGIAINGAGMDFLLGLGRTKITLILNFLKIFVFRIPVLFILQMFIEDGATALGIMMLISNWGICIPTTIICTFISKRLVGKEKSR